MAHSFLTCASSCTAACSACSAVIALEAIGCGLGLFAVASGLPISGLHNRLSAANSGEVVTAWDEREEWPRSGIMAHLGNAQPGIMRALAWALASPRCAEKHGRNTVRQILQEARDGKTCSLLRWPSSVLGFGRVQYMGVHHASTRTQSEQQTWRMAHPVHVWCTSKVLMTGQLVPKALSVTVPGQLANTKHGQDDRQSVSCNTHVKSNSVARDGFIQPRATWFLSVPGRKPHARALLGMVQCRWRGAQVWCVLYLPEHGMG